MREVFAEPWELYTTPSVCNPCKTPEYYDPCLPHLRLCLAVTVFTESELEKDPLREVPAEPYELLDKTRYDFSSKQLPDDREVQLDNIMNKLREECQIKGIMVCSRTVLQVFCMHMVSAPSPRTLACSVAATFCHVANSTDGSSCTTSCLISNWQWQLS